MGGSVWNDPLVAYSTWGTLGSTHTWSPGGVGSISWLHSRMVRDDRVTAQHGAKVWSRPSPNMGLGADTYRLNMKLGAGVSLSQRGLGADTSRPNMGSGADAPLHNHGVKCERALAQRGVGCGNVPGPTWGQGWTHPGPIMGSSADASLAQPRAGRGHALAH
jgi:hypothetical protein